MVKNTKYTWKTLLTAYQATFKFDMNKPLTNEILADPKNPITQNLLFMYTMETWLYRDLNAAGRTKDQSKIMTLGPYANALSWILADAEYCGRKDDPESFLNSNEDFMTLYRGLKLTQDQLNEYIDSQNQMINMPGFTSASFKKQEALVFCTHNLTAGKTPVLMEIKWN